MEYDEFRLRVKPSTSKPGTWDIEVINAYNLPVLNSFEGDMFERNAKVYFTPEMLRRLRSKYGHPNEALLQQAGKAVHQTLLSPKILGVFNYLKSMASQEKRGVRIMVHLIQAEDDELEDDTAAAAIVNPAELPVELMYDDHNSYFASTERTPLVRTFEYRQEPVTLPLTPPLRILIVAASPQGMDKLSIAQEVAKIKEALKEPISAGTVVLEAEECLDATAKKLATALHKGQFTYDIVHFICHGTVTAGGQSYLFLMDDAGTGEPAPMSAEQLNVLLRDRAVRLIVFSSCSTAAPPLAPGEVEKELPPPYPRRVFSGIAQRLITAHEHVGAVVAMQFDLEDSAAVAFSGTFYEWLIARNSTLEKALTEARKAVTGSMPAGHRAWATPVLYSRTRNGKLFDMEQISAMPKLRPEQEAQLQQIIKAVDVKGSSLGQTMPYTELPQLELPLYKQTFAEINELKSQAARLLGNTCWLAIAACAQGGRVSVPLWLRVTRQRTIHGVLLTLQHPPGLVLEGAVVEGAPPASLTETTTTTPPRVPQPYVSREGCSEVFLNFTARPLKLEATAGEHHIGWLNFAAPAFAPGRGPITLSTCLISTAEGWLPLATLSSSMCVAQPSASPPPPPAPAVVAAAGGG